MYSLQFDLLKDLDPIALLTTNPQMLVGRKDLPARNMKELIAWLRGNSDKATYATPGIGSPSHVWGAHFQNITGTRFQFVPYRGAAPAMQGVLSGQLDLACLQASDLLQCAAATLSPMQSCRTNPGLKPSTFRPSMPPACRVSICRSGMAFGHPRIRQETLRQTERRGHCGTERSLFAPALCRHRSGDFPARAGDARGAGPAAEGRDRKMVAHHQGRKHQSWIARGARQVRSRF